MLYLQVIWVIGLAMMALAVLHQLPLKVLALLGVAIIAGQHLLTGLRAEEGSVAYYLLTVLLQRGYLVADGAMKIKVSYPLLPWIGVILLGYAAGPLYARGRSPEGGGACCWRWAAAACCCWPCCAVSISTAKPCRGWRATRPCVRP